MYTHKEEERRGTSLSQILINRMSSVLNPLPVTHKQMEGTPDLKERSIQFPNARHLFTVNSNKTVLLAAHENISR
jgi:hypothetical protein